MHSPHHFVTATKALQSSLGMNPRRSRSGDPFGDLTKNLVLQVG